jgi:hypothetical protein
MRLPCNSTYRSTHCRTFKRYHATAARLYALASTAFPALADDLDQGHRYQAARSALLAADGQGHDATQLTGQRKKTSVPRP